MSGARPYLWLFLIAFCARLPFVFIAPAHELKTPITSDFTEDARAYADIGAALAEHHLFGFGERRSAFRPPLYPLMIGGVFALCGENYGVIRLLQALLGAGACLALLALGERLFDRKTGVWAGVGLACYPFALYFTGEIMTETLYMAVTLAAMALLVRALQLRTIGAALLAGGVWGLAIWARPHALAFVIAIGVSAPLLQRLPRLARRPEPGVLGNGAVCAIVATVALLVLTPWSIRNTLLFGKFVPTTTYSGINLYKGLPGKDNHTAVVDLGYNHHQIEDPKLAELPASEPELDARASSYWKRFVVEHPGEYLVEKLKDFGRFWFDFNFAGQLSKLKGVASIAASGCYLAALLLALVGTSLLWKRGRRLPLLLPWSVIAITVVTYVPFYAGKRYRLPTVDPYLILLAAAYLSTLRRRSLSTDLDQRSS